jgi:peroxiredoxin
MTAFRTHTDAFVRANAQVLGVSVDSFAALGEFQDKLGLEFPLVSDFPLNQVGRDYGVYNEDRGIHNRTTIVIDSDGIVRAVYAEARDFESHPTYALDVLKAIEDYGDGEDEEEEGEGDGE